MSEPFFEGIESIHYEGTDSANPLAFRHYDPDRIVLGVRMEDHLRPAVCYWHTFCWPGSDVFGEGTFERPWFGAGDPMVLAETKLDAAFEFFEKLGAPFFTFHDRDLAPEGATLAESRSNLAHMLERTEAAMERTGVRLLWGTANLFGHPRYAAGAATHPDPEVFAYAADLSTEAGPKEFIGATVKEFGSLDILVCNSGGPPATILANTSPDAWQEALDMSLLSTIRLVQAAVPYMQRNRWGRIVCNTSISVKSPLPGLILSNMARPGVVGFAKSVATEFATDGITVNVVCPGYMATGRVEELAEAHAEKSGKSLEEVMVDLVAEIPAGRMGEPKELGELVAFLASERASYITGTTIQIDGGYVRSLL